MVAYVKDRIIIKEIRKNKSFFGGWFVTNIGAAPQYAIYKYLTAAMQSLHDEVKLLRADIEELDKKSKVRLIKASNESRELKRLIHEVSDDCEELNLKYESLLSQFKSLEGEIRTFETKIKFIVWLGNALTGFSAKVVVLMTAATAFITWILTYLNFLK